MLPAFTIRLLLLSMAVILIGAINATATRAQTSNNSTISAAQKTLTRGAVIERELKGGEIHSYQLEMMVGQYLHVVVDQRGVDLVVEIFAPDGKKILSIDSPNGTTGPEPVYLLSEQSGAYRLVIASLDQSASAGRYQATVQELRKAIDTDIPRVAGYRSYFEAIQLQTEGSAESLTKARGKYEEAIALFHVAEEKFAEADALNFLGLFLQFQGDYAKAEISFQRAIAIYEKAARTETAEYATMLNGLGALYIATNDFTKATQLLEKALKIREKTVGPDSIEVATTISNLALVEQGQGEYLKTIPLFQRAVAIFEKVLGTEHPYVGTTINNLGQSYYYLADYAKAEATFQRALAIREKAFGMEHPDVATTLNNLALVYQDKANYEKAGACFQRALLIYQKVIGSENPIIANLLSNMAQLSVTQGDYVTAEQLFQKALAIKEKTLGVEHSSTAATINNLALLYQEKGDYERAELLFQRVITISEHVLGPEHPQTGQYLNNFGGLYTYKDDYIRAEQIFQRALSIYEKAVGAETTALATILNNLGVTYLNLDNYDKAESYFRRAIAIKERELGPDHPDIAVILNVLADNYQAQGDVANAEKTIKRALSIREKALDFNNPNLANSYASITKFAIIQGDIKQAINYLNKCNEIREHNLMLNLVAGSQAQKIKYLKLTDSDKDFTIALHQQFAPDNQQACRDAMTIILRRKGRALDAMTDAIAQLRKRAKPEDLAIFDELTQTQAELSNLSLKGPGKEGVEQHRKNLQALAERVEKLESDISARSAALHVQLQPITLTAVQQLIPADAALIEFVTYQRLDIKTRQYDRLHYTAYLLTSSGEPQWVDLGEADKIDQAIAQFRRLLVKQDGRPLSNIEEALKPAARSLDELIMKPVRKLTGNQQRLLISPDGALNLIPFDALVDEDNHYLIEKYQISYLTSGRDLLRLQQNIDSRPPLIIADPTYGTGPGPVLLGKNYPPLTRLIGTASEAKQIKSQFPDAVIESQSSATEKSLKAVNSPKILHIATHGYFMADRPSEFQGASSKVRRGLSLEADTKVNISAVREANPLLRSFLFFANANRNGDSSATADDDGVMTALEAAGLNLIGTKLVVLSACDSGLGDVKNGDGVYGLRRALVLAGAETQLISLWSVDDEATRDLMASYYQQLKSGESRIASLRETQLALLNGKGFATGNNRRILLHEKPESNARGNHREQQRAVHNYRHPYYWASFIQSGEWADLNGKR